MASETPKDTRRKPKKVGRRKEEGGHKPLNISVNKSTWRGLKKLSNASEFIEKVLKPKLEQLDPGETCPIVWEFDRRLKTEMINATRKGKYDKVDALSTVANFLQPFRELCGTSPSNLKFPKPLLSKDPVYAILRKDLEEAKNLYVEGEYLLSYEKLVSICHKLPSNNAKEKIMSAIQIANNEYRKLLETHNYMMYDRYTPTFYKKYVPIITDAISEALYLSG